MGELEERYHFNILGDEQYFTDMQNILSNFDSRITVNIMMESKQFPMYRLIAGRDGADRPIRSIAVFEPPDPLTWVRGGEVICSTFQKFADQPHALAGFVKRLAEKNIAALIVNPVNIPGGIPDGMLLAADQHHLPLLEYRGSPSWAAVTSQMYDFALRNQAENLMLYNRLRNRLQALAALSDGIGKFVEYLSSALERPSFIFDQRFVVLASQKTPLEEGEPADEQETELCAFLSGPEFKEIMGHVIQEKCGAVADRSFIFSVELKGGVHYIKAFPSIINEQLFGWLMVSTRDINDIPLIETYLVRASHSLNTLLYMQSTEFMLRTKERNNLLQVLLSDCSSVSDIQDISHKFRINIFGPVAILVIRLQAEITSFTFNHINELLRLNPLDGEAFYSGKELTVLWSFKSQSEYQSNYPKLDESIGVVLDYLTSSGISYYAGLSDMRVGWEWLSTSYNEAALCARNARKLKKGLVAHQELGIAKLIPFFCGNQQLKKFRDEMLKGLLSPEYESIDALKTVETYIQCNCNQTVAAQALHIHVNTLKYRLGKICKVLGVDLNSLEECALVIVAIKIHNNLNSLAAED